MTVPFPVEEGEAVNWRPLSPRVGVAEETEAAPRETKVTIFKKI
jgi:hypothetical protein